jgi:hypothetical protein
MKIELIRIKFPPPVLLSSNGKLPPFLAGLTPEKAAGETASRLLLSESKKSFLIDKEDLPESLWFMGDVHADANGLLWAMKYILSIDTNKPHIVFLGDFIDRGTQPVETFTLLLTLIFEDRIKAILLSGNHDVGFTYDPGERRFDSNVTPCDFTELLNRDLRRSKPDETLQYYGRFWASLAPHLKLGILFDGGVYAAHAGFVKQSFTAQLRDFIRDPDNNIYSAIRFDLVWMRYQPGIRSDGTGYFNNGHFGKFREALKTHGHHAELMVRAHDHPRNGFTLSEDAPEIITLNNSSASGYEPDSPLNGTIGLGRYFPEKKLFEIHALTTE